MQLSEQVSRTLDFLRGRKQSYLSFKAAAGVPFLRDLANFCRANETCVVKDKDGRIDEKATLLLEGRREVWLRIQQHFNLTSQQLLALYSGRDYLNEEDNA
jgi:hypothetical protein